jgi:hypothetical protein
MRSCRNGVLALLISASSATAVSQATDWTPYRSGRFGYTLFFPAEVFQPRRGSPSGDGFEFLSRDGQAKLKVFAAYNTDNVGITEYRAAIMRDFVGYDHMVYGPMGQSWFVLSGLRDGSIFYQKVIFTCEGHVINAFALTYPKEQKRDYDDIVTGIEKSFRPSREPRCYAKS